MRAFCLVVSLVALIGVVCINSTRHGFLANSSRYIGGLNFQRLPPLLLFVLEKSSVEIPCTATQHNVKVSWLREKSTRYTVLETGSLYIKRVKLSDEGHLRCLLTNNDNNTISSHSVSLKVVNANTFWEQAAYFNLTAAEKSVWRLSCPVGQHDAPPPYGYKLSWVKANKQLKTSDRITLLENGALIIKNSRKSDAGVYRCKAIFGNGDILSPPYTVTISDELTIEEEESKTYLKPYPPQLVLNTPMVVNAVEGHSAELECITNNPSLEPHHWERRHNLTIQQNSEIIAGTSLLLKHVTVNDSGIYKCKSPRAQESPLRLVRLLVPRSPEIWFPPPDTLTIGPHVRFNCTATGVPQPSIEILRNGLPLDKHINYDTKGPMSIMTNTVSYGLHISYISKKDQGTFQCIARNKAGVSSEVLILKIGQEYSVPHPKNVMVGNYTSSSIHYRWQKFKLLPVKPVFMGYIVYFHPTGWKENLTELVLQGTAFDKEYTNLLPDTNYTFVIRAFQVQNNHTIISEPVHVYQKTTAERPQSEPDVHFSLRKNTIHVRWSRTSYKDTGGKIVKQKIQWKKEGDLAYLEKALDANISSFVIKGRDPSSSYLIRVLQSTSAGYSLQHQNWIEVRDNKHRSTLADRHKTLNIGMCLKSNKYSNILITWDNILELEEEILNIDVGTEFEMKIYKVQAYKQRLLVEDLRGGCYKVHLVGSSRYTTRVEADAFICTVVPEKEVTSLKYRLYSSQVIEFSSDMISITWSPNTYDYFIIEVSTVAFLPNTLEGNVSSDNPILYTHDNAPYEVFDKSILIVTCRSANLTLLYPATSYKIRIIAATAYMKGLPSSPLFVTTLDRVPSAPINYNVKVLTTSSVNITWLPPIDVNGYLLRYEVSYSSDKAAWKTAISSPNTQHAMLAGLISNTFYYVRIVATTKVGNGQVLEGVICIPAELIQYISPHMIALCVISVFVFTASLVLTYLCTKMFRLRKAASYVESDNNPSSPHKEHSSSERQKSHSEDRAMLESSSSPNSQQFSNNVDTPRTEFKVYGVSGCRNYVPSTYKESSFTLLQQNNQNSLN